MRRGLAEDMHEDMRKNLNANQPLSSTILRPFIINIVIFNEHRVNKAAKSNKRHIIYSSKKMRKTKLVGNNVTNEYAESDKTYYR